jgi:hypothetical protein
MFLRACVKIEQTNNKKMLFAPVIEGILTGGKREKYQLGIK